MKKLSAMHKDFKTLAMSVDTLVQECENILKEIAYKFFVYMPDHKSYPLLNVQYYRVFASIVSNCDDQIEVGCLGTGSMYAIREAKGVNKKAKRNYAVLYNSGEASVKMTVPGTKDSPIQSIKQLKEFHAFLFRLCVTLHEDWESEVPYE